MPAAATSRPRVQLWCPELFAVGGIQAYSRHFLNALRRSEQVNLTDVLTRNDERLPADFPPAPGTRFSLCGRGGTSAGRVKFAAALVHAALVRRPELVITTHLYFAPVARALQRLARIPFWTVVHGVEAWGPIRPALAKALRAADRILAVSRFTRDRVIERHGVDPARVHLLPNTLEAERFVPGPRPPELLARYGLRPDQPILLTVARMEATERYKGVDEILTAWPEVLAAVPDAHYLILGQGTDRARLERLVQDQGLAHSVTFTNNVERDELGAHYNLCDLFAMPSRGEGFGIVFLEALACGKPVLAGNGDGSVDPLRDGELGLLVDPDNLRDLRDAIIAVLQKRHPHPNLFRPAFLREQAIAHFGVDRFRATLEAQLSDFFAARQTPV